MVVRDDDLLLEVVWPGGGETIARWPRADIGPYYEHSTRRVQFMRRHTDLIVTVNCSIGEFEAQLLAEFEGDTPLGKDIIAGLKDALAQTPATPAPAAADDYTAAAVRLAEAEVALDDALGLPESPARGSERDKAFDAFAVLYGERNR